MVAISGTKMKARSVQMAVFAGLACAFAIGKAVPLTMDAISTVTAPLCAVSDPAGSALDTVEPIASYALPNVPGKRVTIVRVFYGPGGFTRAHRHAGSVTAYITKGEIRSQLAGGPVLRACQHEFGYRVQTAPGDRKLSVAHGVVLSGCGAAARQGGSV